MNKLIMQTLRRASSRWMPKHAAKKQARQQRLVGKYKNGKDKYLFMFRCASCRQEFTQTQVEMDHIVPVIALDPKENNWDGIINRLFCESSGFQVLCKPCHKAKSKKENSLRG